jgi:hypothetical protein
MTRSKDGHDEGEGDGDDRLGDLIAFARHMEAVGETLVILGREWGGERGAALAAYGEDVAALARRAQRGKHETDRH